MVFKLKRTVKLRTWRSLFGFFGFIFVFSNLSARFCRTAFPSRSSYQRQLQIHRSLLRSNAASQLPPLFRLLLIVLWFDVRSDLSQSAAFAPPLSVSSVGQTPVTPLRDFETSLAANAWKAGDLGLTRQWMARALRGLPWEQGRGLLGGREGGRGSKWYSKHSSEPPSDHPYSPHTPSHTWATQGVAPQSSGTNGGWHGWRNTRRGGLKLNFPDLSSIIRKTPKASFSSELGCK